MIIPSTRAVESMLPCFHVSSCGSDPSVIIVLRDNMTNSPGTGCRQPGACRSVWGL